MNPSSDYPCAEMRALHHDAESILDSCCKTVDHNLRLEATTRCWLYINCAITITHALAAIFFSL